MAFHTFSFSSPGPTGNLVKSNTFNEFSLLLSRHPFPCDPSVLLAASSSVVKNEKISFSAQRCRCFSWFKACWTSLIFLGVTQVPISSSPTSKGEFAAVLVACTDLTSSEVFATAMLGADLISAGWTSWIRLFRASALIVLSVCWYSSSASVSQTSLANAFSGTVVSSWRQEGKQNYILSTIILFSCHFYINCSYTWLPFFFWNNSKINSIFQHAQHRSSKSGKFSWF